MSHRLRELRLRLQQANLDAILVSQAENRRYLSGFNGSAGFLLITQASALLATDFRYIEQAQQQAPGFEIFPISGDIASWFPEFISHHDIKRLGVEANDITQATYQQLTGLVGKRQVMPTTDIVESLRAVKDPGEFDCIRRAVEIADAAFEGTVDCIKPGMTERQVAWEMEKALREGGSESLPFDIIVASGPSAALPHHRPDDRVLQVGEPVIIDMGARVEGYCSDLSRTVFTGGKEDKKFGKMYDLVLGAQLTAMATIAGGMSGEQADSLARGVIELGGYGQQFGHGLGHGIGLAPHELPRLGRGSTDVLEDGMVFTVEPGIYITGWGGVRIEDTVVLEQGRVKALSKAHKQSD